MVLDVSSAQWLCSAPKASEAAVKKSESSFEAVLFLRCLAASWHQSDVVAPVVKKDRVAEKKTFYLKWGEGKHVLSTATKLKKVGE